MKELLNIDWEKKVRRNTNYLAASLIHKGGHSYFYPTIGIKQNLTYAMSLNKDLYWSKAEMDAMYSEIKEGFEKDEKYLHKIIKKSYRLCSDFEDFEKDIENQNFSKHSNKELLDVFKRACELIKQMGPVILQIVAVDPFLNKELDKRLKILLEKKGLTEKFEEYSQLIKTPTKDNFNVFETKAILRIAIKIQNDYMKAIEEGKIPQELKKDVDDYLKDFSWISSRGGHITIETTEEDVIERLKGLVKEDCEIKLEHLNNERIENEKKLLAVLGEINPNEKLSILID
ncbi:MAG: hypothetical protein V3V78_02465, partial [Candidatus Woesearchaeota archaeon]